MILTEIFSKIKMLRKKKNCNWRIGISIRIIATKTATNYKNEPLHFQKKKQSLHKHMLNRDGLYQRGQTVFFHIFIPQKLIQFCHGSCFVGVNNQDTCDM